MAAAQAASLNGCINEEVMARMALVVLKRSVVVGANMS